MAEPEPQAQAQKQQLQALVIETFGGDINDVIVELRLPREVLAVGGNVPFSFMRRVPCASCKGLGRTEGAPACETCNGGGTMPKQPDAPTPFVGRCGTCDGRGHALEHACKECEGGLTKVEATVEVDVPRGSGPGMQLRIRGQGHTGLHNPQGDVIVVLARAVEEASPAAQKLPSFILLVVVTIVVLVLALRMAR